jgi:hypothetical protein
LDISAKASDGAANTRKDGGVNRRKGDKDDKKAKKDCEEKAEKSEREKVKAKGESEMKAEKQKAKMEKRSEQDKKEKKKLKAAKEQAKMATKAEMETKGKNMSLDDMPGVAGIAVSSLQQLLEFQTKAREEDHVSWRREREAWSLREQRLLETIETLSHRITEMSSSQTASSSGPSSIVEAAKPIQPKITFQTDAPLVPEPVLGGRGVLDVLDAIEEVNRRFGGNRDFETVKESVAEENSSEAIQASPAVSEPEGEKEPEAVVARSTNIETVESERVSSKGQ